MNLARKHPDPLAATLPPLVLDRQRVVHSAAFRRLQHKTQAFVAPDTDHIRTRMTHTLEVAHLARCLAHRLALSSDLAEVVALAHDLGHPPFGHAGEQALNEKMHAHGGFEHNRHTLRIVEELEHPYPDFRGLNLTHVVRECLAKHSTRYDRPGTHPLQDGQPAPPEGVLVDLADRFTYALHDLQDGLYAGLIAPADLAPLALWQRSYTGTVSDEPDAWRPHLRPTVDRIRQELLEAVRPVPNADRPGRPELAGDAERELDELDAFLAKRVYRSERIRSADEQARSILGRVFDAFAAKPELLPARFAGRVAKQGVQRVVADYVAGMTDRFCVVTAGQLGG